MNIYSILSSKEHNKHYLDRYIKFIYKCTLLNSLNEVKIVEKHHICPKAKDMFPEYEDFKTNEWNCALLAPRQHFIAHIILWKAFNTIRSCKESLWFMSNGKWQRYSRYSVIYENLKIQLIDTWKENGRSVGKTSLNSVPVYDKNSKSVIKISKDDVRYKNGELQHHSKGYKVGKNSEGDIIYARKDDIRFTKEYFSLNKNMVPVKDGHGNYFQVSKNDPRFKSGELTHNSKGTMWINNGVEEKTVDRNSIIPDDWNIGRITSNTKGTIWIKNPTNNKRKRIKPCDFERYKSQGFIRGR
jgi:hypothetical protein